MNAKASRELERIRSAILDQRYTLSEHSYDEMADDCSLRAEPGVSVAAARCLRT